MGITLAKQSIDLGIVTTNGEAMLAFYRDVVGLKYLTQIPMPGGLGGVMHRMMCGDSMIKLVVFSDVPAKAPPGGIPGASGYRYWTISVSNLSELTKACVNAGVKVVVGEMQLRPGITITIVEDPDGNFVECLSQG